MKRFIVLGFMIIIASTAFTSENNFHQKMQKLQQSCEQDEQLYCSDKEGPARMDCLVDMADKLTDQCVIAINDIQQNDPRKKVDELMEQCFDDLIYFCDGLERGEKMECSFDAQDEVSRSCKNALKEIKKHAPRDPR